MFDPLPSSRVRITNPFWSERQRINTETAIPTEYDHCQETGRFDALRLNWKPGDKNRPHHFWDSDTAKWLEAACHAWKSSGDPELRRRIDRVADLFIGAQQPDGYINSYFTAVAPEQRWKNLRDMHELYCAGHIFEAAVAHHEVTGTDCLLNAACRYADYIGSVFGTDEGKIPGYPGHEEIELALVRLHKATGVRRYLDLAAYFVNQRGRQPIWFAVEHGDQPAPFPWSYHQCAVPVRELDEAQGHAVRAVYLYSAMADIARETGDETLLDTAQRLWRNVVDRKMYVTGGIGSDGHREAFAGDYDLPNEHAYCETCASVGLVFWAHRMLQHDGEGEYADVLERALHNGALCGMSLDGRKFFYQNPLASSGAHHRSEWFGCSCCPSNISRLIASLGGYLYSTGPSTLLVHQFIGSDADFELDNGVRGTLRQAGHYPWAGRVKISLEVNTEKAWELRVRVPSWADECVVRLNGETTPVPIRKGYACLHREWKTGDTLHLDLSMNIRRLTSHPRVTGNAGQIALQRGPFIYCIEDADFSAGALAVALPRAEQLQARVDDSQFPIPITVIEGQCLSAAPTPTSLYSAATKSAVKTAFRAVPFFAWDNRAPGAMRVWIPEHDA